MLARIARILTALAAISLGACGAAASAAGPSTPADVLLRAQLDTAAWAARSGQQATAFQVLQPIASGPLYSQLSEPNRHLVDELLGTAAFWTWHEKVAHDAFRRATASKLATEVDWNGRLESAKLEADFQDAYAAFKVLREQSPGFELGMDDRTVAVLDQGFGTLADPAPQREWEAYLESRGWQGHGDRASYEEVEFHEAANLLDQGQLDAATAVVQRLTKPYVLAVMAADRRFDAVLRTQPASRFDPQASAQRRLAEFVRESQADPKSIDMLTAVASELYDLGRTEDALAVLQKAAAVPQWVEVGGEGDPRQGAARRLMLAERSLYLFRTGRREEALGVAAGVGCGTCGPNTDSPMMQAGWLVALGRGREALGQLASISPSELTLPARATMAQLGVCASEEAGDRQGAESRLQYLRGHRADDPRALVRAELCLGHEDAAAAATISALADPRQRPLMLEALQIFLPEGDPTPEEQRLSDRLDALRARPDVAAAVQKVGRILRQGVRETDLD